MPQRILPPSVTLSPEIRCLGKYLFQLGSQDSLFSQAVYDAFVPFESSWAYKRYLANSDLHLTSPDAINIDRLKEQYEAQPQELPVLAYVIWCVVDRALSHHIQFYPNDLALEAALLITPKGVPVWLSGGTQTGKTTLVVALALGFNWKIVSEDVVFIDQGEPVPAVAPLSLRPKAPDLINAATGIMPQPLAGTRWLIRHDLFQTDKLPTRTPVAVHLSLTAANVHSDLNVHEIAWTQYVRTVLPISNAPKVANGIDRLIKVFEGGSCLLLQNGNLEMRLNALSNL